MSRRPGRHGSALAGAIVLLLVIECVVLGTVHLALTETRLASSTQLLLRLRLAAESAARQEAAYWRPDLDSLTVGARAADRMAWTGDVVTTRTSVERLSPALFLVRGSARIAPPRHGESGAALLMLAPALPVAAEPAVAAVTAATARIADTGAVHAETSPCGGGAGVAVALTGGADLDADEGATVRGDVVALPAEASLLSAFDRISTVAFASAAAHAAGLRHHAGDVTLSEDYEGVLVVTGDLTLEATLRGLALAGGTLTVAASGALVGAAHAAGHADVAGSLILDDCLVRDAVATARMRHARPLPRRPSIPAF
jgi:hypothetical protein